MNAWLPVHGACWYVWETYPNAKARDYAASQAHKRPGYISHATGQVRTNRGRGQVIFYLGIYVKEQPK